MNNRDWRAQKFEQIGLTCGRWLTGCWARWARQRVPGGVLSGIAALAAGAAPRTASNDPYYRMMLALIGITVLILFLKKRMFIKMQCS
jgi:hypothetical protein